MDSNDKMQTTASEDHDWDKVSDDIPEETVSTKTDNAEKDAETETHAEAKSLETEKEATAAKPAAEEVEKTVQPKEVASEEANDKTPQESDKFTTETEPVEVESGPSALQIVSIGTETDQYAFTFHEDALASIMNKVPSDHKVCVVSVVGAFRTGKSFLLSWFLRYLKHSQIAQKSESGSGDKKWYDNEVSLGNDGFHWRGGAERNTTGIWMWSEPFLSSRETSGVKEDIAVLLVDTQGMFDHETTMGLTAAIFGLSTLLSSYQIYNVDKRIQEDNLQQLALFSEYGRMAIQTDGHQNRENQTNDNEENKSNAKPKPFQKIEFLVRDWQNFEDDEDMDACEAEMKEYLDTVLAEREAADLKDTREQITSCFEEVSCFLMTHPGFGVTKKKYDGNVKVVEPVFKSFMDRYCGKVFKNLIAKSIHGRELTAVELAAYIKNYAKMFESGAHFPEASTMLEATSSANNSNATNLAISRYRERMDQMAGAKCFDYLSPSELSRSHRKLCAESTLMFDGIANFGSAKAIEEAKAKVIQAIEESFEMYSKLNESRNPLLGFETYIIPLTIGFISIVLRWIADFTCSSWSETCRVGSEVLSHVYQVVFFFIIIVASTKAKHVTDAAKRFKKALEVMSNTGQKDKAD